MGEIYSVILKHFMILVPKISTVGLANILFFDPLKRDGVTCNGKSAVRLRWVKGYENVGYYKIFQK